MKPAFIPGTGTVTAPNSSPLNDGGELAGLLLGITPTQDLGNRLEAELLHLSLGNQDYSQGPEARRCDTGLHRCL
jgi:acetyl-CoA acetyltransferase